jgi:hypothetical protein
MTRGESRPVGAEVPAVVLRWIQRWAFQYLVEVF